MTLNHFVFGVCALLLGLGAVLGGMNPRFPGDNRGYEPVQPIAFSHRLHAGDLDLDCQYCHYGARSSRNAGVPSASVCMNCHSMVTASFDTQLEERSRAELEHREPARILSPELAKLYSALGLDADGAPLPGAPLRPIEWVRVHNLPDFVYFDHRVHVAREIACETCHGPVRSMERMRQETDLSMGWCIDCHRSQGASGGAWRGSDEGRASDHVSTNCATCHL